MKEVKKTIDEQIAEHEAAIEKLESERDAELLEDPEEELKLRIEKLELQGENHEEAIKDLQDVVKKLAKK